MCPSHLMSIVQWRINLVMFRKLNHLPPSFFLHFTKRLPGYCGLLPVWANLKTINADKELLNTFSPPLAKEIPCMSWLVTNLPLSMLVNLMPADDTVMLTFMPESLMEGISKKTIEQNSNQHINKMKERQSSVP